MSADKFVQLAIPKFDGHYSNWAMLMENFVRSKEMWSLIEEGFVDIKDDTATEGQKKVAEASKLRDMKVKNYLFQAIDRKILETILDTSTSKKIWESMKQKYAGSTKVKRAQLEALQREYELLSMKEGERVDAYIARTLAVVNKMKANGDMSTSNDVVSKVLRSLTPKFNYVVCSIMESNDLDLLTIDELHGSLFVHEKMILGQQDQEEKVLKITNDEVKEYHQGTRGRGNRGRGSNSNYRGRGRGGRGGPQNKSTIECYKCRKLGHFQ